MAKATKQEQQEVTRRLKKKYPQMYKGPHAEKYWGKPTKKTKRTKQAESQLKAAGLTEKDIAKFR